MNPLEVTEWIIRRRRHGAPKVRWTVHGRLFQARMWREYAMAWNGRPTSSTGVGRDWVAGILKIGRAECIRRARVNVYLARRLNRIAKEHRP